MWVEPKSSTVQMFREQALPLSQLVNKIALKPYGYGVSIGSWISTQASWVNQKNVWLFERKHLTEQQQYIDYLAKENQRLKSLLDLQQTFPLTLIAAPVARSDSVVGTLILSKGSASGIQEGAGVVGVKGVIGFVDKVTSGSAQVLLLNNHRHAIAVQSQRSGVRMMATGGANGRLIIDHVPDTTDIQTGDLLITSGLGDRFPAGLEVAIVTTVEHVAGKPFANISAIPRETLSQLDYVLVMEGKKVAEF